MVLFKNKTTGEERFPITAIFVLSLRHIIFTTLGGIRLGMCDKGRGVGWGGRPSLLFHGSSLKCVNGVLGIYFIRSGILYQNPSPYLFHVIVKKRRYLRHPFKYINKWF